MEDLFLKKQLIELFIKNNYLPSPDILNAKNIDESFISVIQQFNLQNQNKPTIFNQDLLNLLTKENKKELLVNWIEFEKAKVSSEKGQDKEIYGSFLKILKAEFSDKLPDLTEEIKPEKSIEPEKELESNILILKGYKETTKKRELKDFVYYFRSRYESLKKILMNHIELQNTVSIQKLRNPTEKKEVSLIGVVSNKLKTKNKNTILLLEDTTGTINVLINKNRKELNDIAEDIVLDEVIGIKGVLDQNIIFVNELFLPDIPLDLKIKKCEDDVYSVFIGDVHLGLKQFLAEDFSRFISFLNKEFGTKEQKELASKIKYLFIVGDLVEGVGVYPGQEQDLEIKDIYKQYEYLASQLAKIPKEIKIIVCGGNHDALRIAEPQPIFDKKLAKALYDLPNITMVTNPSVVNIHASANFSGFDVLLYHGYSFPFYANEVQSIRTNGGQERIDLIMKFLLQRRHLAPTHTSNLYIPDPTQDSLVIDRVPDFFVTGHLHKICVTNYKNITCLNCSCWASQTADMERRGIIPDPSKAIAVNLKTREIKIMSFAK
ncbi:MAG: metallophosphoesterase [Candidatus Nanoarchaeia archaeon]|nr:metallophosphoesterase [Candidatus Nanoarchaeia archaeon]MDD5587846.1 metallophosphoesterase [Candidatus Nanoarchaeia archaeon]